MFFENDLPSIPRIKPKVFTKFKEYSLLSDDAALVRKRRMGATKAFTHHAFPGVSVAEMQKYGYTPPTGNGILLGKAFVVELETAL